MTTHSQPADHGPPVDVVGIGPGDLEYLTPRGRRAIATAEIVLGYTSVLEYVAAETDADRLDCTYDTEAETLDRFADRCADGRPATVVAMGDPSVSGAQFVDKVDAAVDRPLRIIPGISSIQIAAGRSRVPLEDATFVTLHKRGPIDDDLARLARDAGDRHLIVLPRPNDYMPPAIADHLLDAGASPDLRTTVYEHLTHVAESTTTLTLAELAGRTEPFSEMSVLVIRRGADR